MLARNETAYDPLSDDALLEVERANPSWKIERVGGGFFMTPPTTPRGGIQSARLTAKLATWGDARGYVPFDSSSGFKLADDDIRSPDAALLRESVWKTIPNDAKDSMGKITPDVVAEVVSKTDRIKQVEDKCEQWLRNGVGYVLMLDPIRKKVRVWGTPPRDFPAPEALLAEMLR